MAGRATPPTALATAARALALAEINKRTAAVALAREAGVATAGGVGSQGAGAQDSDQQPMMNVTWYEEFFKQLDTLECTDQERDDLKKLEAELKAVRDSVISKADEVKKWRTQVLDLRQKVQERLGKKRKTDRGDGATAAVGEGGEGQVPTPAPGSATASAPSAPPAGSEPPNAPGQPSETEIQAEMERIRAAAAAGKAAAEAAAAQAPAGAMSS